MQWVGCSYTYHYGNTLNLHYIKITLQTRICISPILLNNVHTYNCRYTKAGGNHTD